MKIRTSFVSNSSSSSFIVIGNSDKYEKPNWPTHLVVDGNFGETEFGWGPETIYDIESRVIFSYFIALYNNKPEWVDMLEEVIREQTDVIDFDWSAFEADRWGDISGGYIDHQSVEDGQNAEIFDSSEQLREFIFNSGSKIVLDNDNH